MTPFFQLRTATLADAETITQFNAAMAEETEGRALDPARLRRGVEAVLQAPSHGTYYVAEAQSNVIGQVLITFEWSDWREGIFWWIQSVYVQPAFREKGVFKALFAFVQKQAQERKDVCGLRLYVDAHNKIAKDTYARLGMKPTQYEIYEQDFVLTPNSPLKNYEHRR